MLDSKMAEVNWVECPRCGNAVSRNSSQCPTCGKNVKTYYDKVKSNAISEGCGTIVAIGLFILFAGFIRTGVNKVDQWTGVDPSAQLSIALYTMLVSVLALVVVGLGEHFGFIKNVSVIKRISTVCLVILVILFTLLVVFFLGAWFHTLISSVL